MRISKLLVVMEPKEGVAHCAPCLSEGDCCTMKLHRRTASKRLVVDVPADCRNSRQGFSLKILLTNQILMLSIWALLPYSAAQGNTNVAEVQD